MTWEIVCPDGLVRHYPYANRDDAEFDAKLCDERSCRLYPEPSVLEEQSPPCVGHPHRVREHCELCIDPIDKPHIDEHGARRWRPCRNEAAHTVLDDSGRELRVCEEHFKKEAS